LIVGWCGRFLFFVVPRQFSRDAGEWPENQILIPDWTYFHCPGTTLLTEHQKFPKEDKDNHKAWRVAVVQFPPVALKTSTLAQVLGFIVALHSSIGNAAKECCFFEMCKMAWLKVQWIITQPWIS